MNFPVLHLRRKANRVRFIADASYSECTTVVIMMLKQENKSKQKQNVFLLSQVMFAAEPFI